jgi:peroxiredoxin family protein
MTDLATLQAEIDTIKANMPEDKFSMVVCNGGLDNLLAAFIIATGAAAMFEKVTMFFTFWAIPALRDPAKVPPKKDLFGTMFGWMLPKGSPALKLSQMHMAGAGTGMMKMLMKKKNVLSLEQLMKTAADAGVQIYICEMSMNLMGFTKEEMIDYPNLKLAGVGTFLAESGTSKASLFI